MKFVENNPAGIYARKIAPARLALNEVIAPSELSQLRRELAFERQRNQELVERAQAEREKFSRMAQMSKFLAFRAIEVLRASQERQNERMPLVNLASQIAHQTKLLAMGLGARLSALLPGENGRDVIRNVREIKLLAEEAAQAVEKII